MTDVMQQNPRNEPAAPDLDLVDALWEKPRTDFKVELMVVFAILVSLGFPGSYTKVYGETMGTVLEYAAFGMELLAMLISSGNNWLNIRLIRMDVRYIMNYALVGGLFASSMYVTRYPSEQIITCVRLVVTMLFAVWLQEQFTLERLLELICISQVIFIFFVVMFMIQHPGLAFEDSNTFVHALRGFSSAKNTFASELVFGILTASFLLRDKRTRNAATPFWIGIVVVQAFLFAMCQATGALFAMGIAFIPFLMPRKFRMPLGWMYIIVSIGFLWAMLNLMPYFEDFFVAIGKDATLTGRIPLWERIIDVMEVNNTWHGFGYSMFWRDNKAVALIHAGFDQYSYMANMTNGGHNVILEFWLNSGRFGVLLLFAALLYATRRPKDIPDLPYIYSSMIIVYLMINGLTERCLGGNYDYKMLVWFLVMSLCCNRPPKEESVFSSLLNARRTAKR